MEKSGKICTGFGHRNCSYWLKTTDLKPIMLNLMKNCGVDTFYTGGNGDFDLLFITAVRSLKKEFPEIQLCLVSAYFSDSLNKNKEYYEMSYDTVIIPEGQELAHPKGAIKLRNRWIVDNSDYIISGVIKDYGGAFEAIKYAKKQNKSIIEIQLPKKES